MTLSPQYDLRTVSPRDRRAYVTEQLSTIIGRLVMPADTQVERWWWLLAREEERESERDAHGNFVTEASQLAALHLLEDPPLHADVLALARQPRVTCWPSPFRFAACLTHDVDAVTAHPWRERLRRLSNPRISAGWMQRARWALSAGVHAGDRREDGPFDDWMAAEARYGFRSTFFVMPESYVCPTVYDHYHWYADPVRHFGARMNYADAARQTCTAGWEIGLHGSYASAHDADILRVEKTALETMLEAEVVSTRQHYLRFDIALTPRAWSEIGLRADSTMGAVNSIGYRSGLAFPYFWPGDGDILEVPLSLHDLSIFRAPSRDQKDTLERRLARARALIARVAAIGGIVTLSWHTQPDYRGALDAYRVLLRDIAELGGWGCTLGEVNAWWRARRTSVRRQFVPAMEETNQTTEVHHAQ
ncbi:MAG: hypothetical protein BWY76_01540 [bacterium ADurb.Bin429]|nr:MAG: hypothetical protein BWY76_01540 [bacterium ADurb.Bin429]